MITPNTLSLHDAREIRACVAHDAAEAFNRFVEQIMTWYAWDESERDEATVACLAYALFCFHPDSIITPKPDHGQAVENAMLANHPDAI